MLNSFQYLTFIPQEISKILKQVQDDGFYLCRMNVFTRRSRRIESSERDGLLFEGSAKNLRTLRAFVLFA